MTPLMLAAVAWAAQTNGVPAQPQPSVRPLIVAMIAIFVVFYFLIIRPQKQEQRKRQEMLDSVAKGDSVVTTGGIIGTVESVDSSKGIVALAVAPKVTIRVTKSAIATVTARKGKGGEASERTDKADLAEKAG